MNTAYFNRFTIELTDDQVDQAYHQGQCYSDCKDLMNELSSLNIDRELMISELLEYGAWDNEELNDLDDNELEIKLVWLAAGNIKEVQNE